MDNNQTALNAVLTYRLKNTQAIIEEIFTPMQRAELQQRIDSLRAIQVEDEYIQQNVVDYMVTSFR